VCGLRPREVGPHQLVLSLPQIPPPLASCCRASARLPGLGPNHLCATPAPSHRHPHGSPIRPHRHRHHSLPLRPRMGPAHAPAFLAQWHSALATFCTSTYEILFIYKKKKWTNFICTGSFGWGLCAGAIARCVCWLFIFKVMTNAACDWNKYNVFRSLWGNSACLLHLLSARLICQWFDTDNSLSGAEQLKRAVRTCE